MGARKGVLVNQDRIREISTEMCHLLDEQTKLLNNGTSLCHMSREELGGYAQRNDRIHQLCTELNDLV